MQNNNSFFPRDLYLEHLGVIKGIQFTRREIDVMACFVNVRGTSKISSVLSISPHTVLTHTRSLTLKLGCNSREGIIDFVEESHKLGFFKEHYGSLLVNAAFKKSLHDLAKLKKEEECLYIIFDGLNQDLKRILASQLENHLNQVGIHSEIQENYGTGKIEDWGCKEGIVPIVLTSSGGQLPEISGPHNVIDVEKYKNYFFLFFAILSKTFDSSILESIFRDFKEAYESIEKMTSLPFPQTSSAQETLENQIHASHSVTPSSTILQKKKEKVLKPMAKQTYLAFHDKKWHLLFIVFLVGVASCGFLLILENKQTQLQGVAIAQPPVIRSDFVIPSESTLLDRSELMAQIESKFKGTGLQTVALVGMGGVGKTTLACQYARKQKAPVIWQIKAQTPQTLQQSFESLALSLAKTEEDKKHLKEIQAVEDLTEKEDKIVQFVKKHLKTMPNWLLVYDNVENFLDIEKYFPQDLETWGQGKILLTTRDSNIESNKHVNHMISIKELPDHQILTLFAKIITNGAASSSTIPQNNELKQFLQRIPPYPLDVSIAAHYLKATQVSYHKYLEQMLQDNKDFAHVQENILKQSGDYIKTRYSIISLTLQHLAKIHPDFEDLLLFISLLDSQNIPRDLLEKHKGVSVVDSFVYHLKKHSLITNEASPLFGSIPTFSIHRSTQAILHAYLLNNGHPEKNKKSLQKITTTLENYIAEAINDQDLPKMNLLANHCSLFSGHTPLLSKALRKALEGELGGLYFYLGYHKKAKKLLENTISHFRASPQDNAFRMARALGYLGSVYRWLGDYEKAKPALEQSLAIYQKKQPQDHDRTAWAMVLLGVAYRELGDYEKAKELFKQSLVIYKQYFPTNYVRIAWTLAHLGIIYKNLGEYEKSQEALNQSLAIYKEHLSKSPARYAWASTHLGNVYRQQGLYEKAKTLLEQSLETTKNHLPEFHADIAWSLVHLGNTYQKLGNYPQAQELLEQSLHIFEKHRADNPVRYAWAAAHLANLHRKLGNYEKAKALVEKSLTTFQKNLPQDHDRVAWALTLLGIILSEQGHHEKAKEYLERSLRVYKTKFSKHHHSIAWTMAHLGPVYGYLGRYEEAKALLQTSQKAYEKIYGKNHIKMAQLLHTVGKVYLQEGRLEDAQQYLQKSLHLSHQNAHVSAFLVLEDLSKWRLKKKAILETQGARQQAQVENMHAMDALKHALTIARASFAKDSPHIIRIESNIKKVSESINSPR